jgi:hypothetical protein
MTFDQPGNKFVPYTLPLCTTSKDTQEMKRKESQTNEFLIALAFAFAEREKGKKLSRS